MRDGQAVFVDDAVAEQDEIEIERAGGVLKRPLASALALDGQQQIEDLARGQRSGADGGGIQKLRLRLGDTDGFGIVVAGDAEIGDDSLETGDGVIEMGAAVAEVAAERDRDGRRSYSIQRLGRTSPWEGPRTSARRPSKSVRPASA